MTDLKSQIADLRSELDRSHEQTFAVLEQAVSMIQKSFRSEIVRQSEICQRLSRLEIVAKLADGEAIPAIEVEEHIVEERPRRSASDIILHRLRDSRSPVPTSELDELVTEQGLTRSAAIKAKSNLRKDGFVTAAKCRWSITAAGRRKINGHHPPGGP
ncbi:hypothetical protein [Chenggangzhangella methanolivorans]|uniref:Uncharacterized protein n=1 Tax=Chenggangzhangella methanolivorans TaxID=1437009 RepID=A0A9E6R9J8_9HYPH|nr:hypothetical protein [Chenggangzhangella methanolivorans]QZN99142.1 hypothetical protein K6K41_20210 [Chenggangzhangella methanolivorans]